MLKGFPFSNSHSCLQVVALQPYIPFPFKQPKTAFGLFWFILICSSTLIYAQETLSSEELQQELTIATIGSDSIALLVEIADHNLFNGKELARESLKKAQHIAERDGLDSLLAEVYYEWQQFYLYQDDFDKSLVYLDSAAQLFTKVECDRCLANVNDNKGNILTLAGRYNEAYAVLFKAYEQYLKSGDELSANGTRMLLGSTLDYLKVFDQATAYYEEAFAYFETGVDTAEVYYQFAFGATSYGILLARQEKYDTALKYFRLGRQLGLRFEDEYGVFSAELNIGWIQAKTGVLDSAFINCKRGLDLSLTYEDKFGEEFSCKCLGLIALQQKKYAEAEDYLVRADSLASMIAILDEELEVSDYLVELYEELGNYELAHVYQSKHRSLSDSTYNASKAGLLAYMQTQFGITEEQQKNTELQKDLIQQTELNRFYLLVGILGVLVTLLVMRLLWLERGQKERLQELVDKHTADLRTANEELKEFAYITSHDMREPIRSINSFATLSQRRLKEGNHEELHDFLQIISDSSLQLHALVTDVYNFIRIDNTKLHQETFSIGDILMEIRRDLSSAIQHKNAQIELRHNLKVQTNRSLLKIVLRNLVENAIKYNETEVPKVVVEVEETASGVRLAVSDNGVGISEEYWEYVFRMFKRLHNRKRYPGSGLGLAICRKIIRKLGGEIIINGVGLEGKGIQVSLTLPKEAPVTIVQEVMSAKEEQIEISV